MDYLTSNKIINIAWKNKIVIPGFNIPYIPMMEPVVKALKDMNTMGFIMVARLEWIKFEAKGLEYIYKEYKKVGDRRVTRLHLDHIPVIDEDGKKVNFERIILHALDLGYDSVMVDGSRLSLSENIESTKRIVDIAHNSSVPVEAELGAVLGHENEKLPPYKELFNSGKGFTSPEEAEIFVKETSVDWLSIAFGNIHGAISKSMKDKKKISAKLNIEHLKKVREKVNIPLVLHGGTGIKRKYIYQAIKNGIAKINIATAIRQPYEREKEKSLKKAQEVVYKTVIKIIKNELKIQNSANFIYQSGGNL